MAREKLSPVYRAADNRPRVYLRLADRSGKVAIGFRAHPAGTERFADSVELALGEALEDVAAPAVIMWEGLGLA